MAAALQPLGVTVAAHDPPRRRAERVRQVLGERGDELARQLESLDRARYAPDGKTPPLRPWWRGFARAAAQVTPRAPSR